MTKRENAIKTIETLYGENAQYILASSDVKHKVERIDIYTERGDERMEQFLYEGALKRAKEFDEERLTPVKVNVGDGVTVRLFSDAHAATVIKKTKCSITVQYDIATLDPNFKPEFIEGGFAGHCVNQNEQTYTYERNENGRVETYRWSKKYNRYQGGGDGSIIVTKGRHEFYDYNF